MPACALRPLPRALGRPGARAAGRGGDGRRHPRRAAPRGARQAHPTRGAPAAARGPPLPGAEAMDDVIHAERLDVSRGKRTYTERLSRLPDGAMVAGDDGEAYLVHDRTLLRWTPAGYAERRRPRGTVSY